MPNLWRSYCVFLLSLIGFMGSLTCRAQGPAASSTKDGVLTGVVVDPSGATVAAATVHVEGHGIERNITTDSTGRFNLSLPAGFYEVIIVSAGFDPYVGTAKIIGQGSVTNLPASLVIATQTEQVDVAADNSSSTSGADNKSATVLKADDIKSLSTDDGTFQQEVLALAGGGDPQQPPQVYVDGFSGGQFPPKNSIREIRINQNPFSAEYSELGFGRIEIFTKPGSNKFHGELNTYGNDDVFNARNPYSGTGPQPPYHSVHFYGNVSGPIGKNTSFFTDGSYNDQLNNSIVNATTLDANLQPVAITETVTNPQTTGYFSAKLDRQWSTNNTFTGHYQFNRASLTNSGIGQLVLPSEGYNSSTTTQTLQLSNTQVIGTKMTNEMHFQYIRTRLQQNPTDTSPTIVVQGAFNGGGSPTQQLHDNQDAYEFQEYFSLEHKTHFFRMGGRYRLYREANLATANYNGQYIFPNITAYQITEAGLQNGASDQTIRATCQQTTTSTSPICGGATQLTITGGQTNASVSTGDLSLYAEDEWKPRKDFTVDLGFRFETQSAIPDHVDPAPRIGLAWAVGQTDKRQPFVVLRTGTGLFYDRFKATNLLTTIRENGVAQLSYTLNNPSSDLYPLTKPSLSSLISSPPTIYQVDPNLRSEYTITSGFTAERALGKKGNISANYLYNRGDRQWLTRNINAPLPGTYIYGDPTSGVRPLGTQQNVYQFASTGITKSNVFFINGHYQATKRINLFAAYVIPAKKSDASGATSFASNQYDPSVDFGRTATSRHRLFSFASLDLPLGISSYTFFSWQGGVPFNITTGTDLNGDTQFNDRPAFATDLTRPSVVRTRFGNFDTSPLPTQTIIPINYGNSPSFVYWELGLSKHVKFGPRPAPEPLAPGTPAPKTPAPKPDPRYDLTFNFEADNVLNHVNPGVPVGVLGSPFFGQSISLNNPFQGNTTASTAANRLISFGTSFTF